MRGKEQKTTVTAHHQTTCTRSNGVAVGFGQAETAHPTQNIEPGRNTSWSNSKVWISEEEKIRGRYSAMRTNAKHLGLENSPFLPKTPGEYAAVLAEKKADEAKKVAKKAQEKEEKVKVEQPLRGKNFGDGLSTVLAMDSAFNEIPAYDNNTIDKYWPPAWAYFHQRGS